MRGRMLTAGIAAGLALLAPAIVAADCPSATTDLADLLPPAAMQSGEDIRVRGVVSGDFRGDDGLRGFFLQTRSDSDELPHGIFVFTPDLQRGDLGFGAGDEVVVTGESADFRGKPQIAWVQAVEVCARPGLPEPVTLPFPQADRDGWRRLEGVHVRVDETLTVTGNYDLARFGALDLAAGGRLFRPTQFTDTRGDDHAARRIILDDASYARNPRPVPWLDRDGTRRVGSVLPELSGILTHAFGAWRIHPVEPEAVEFVARNPRPDPPAAKPGAARVVGFNVENYFVTLGERGAANRAELDQQRQQLEAVAGALQPALVGLAEVENRPAAVTDLTERLGRAAVGRAYQHFAIDEPVGTDAIRVALAWDPARVERVAGPFIDTADTHHRPPVAGHFRFGDEGPGKLVVVIHHKAKVGCPDEGDIDRGQGCWNLRRTEQSRALADFLQRKRERTGTDRVLIIGDINSYAAEDPVRLLQARGFGDLLASLPPEQRYTYVFRGESGNLDVALASESLAGDVTAARPWPINADEPAALHDFTRVDGPWRSSDHDPVVVDIHTRDGTRAE